MTIHYEEITKRILACGLWHTNGKTPAAINAQLANDIKRNGTSSLFIRPSPAHYVLNPSLSVQTSALAAFKPSNASKPNTSPAIPTQLTTPNSQLLTPHS